MNGLQTLSCGNKTVDGAASELEVLKIADCVGLMRSHLTD